MGSRRGECFQKEGVIRTLEWYRDAWRGGCGSRKFIDDLYKGIQSWLGWLRNEWEGGNGERQWLLLTDFIVKGRSHGVVAESFENQRSLFLSLLLIFEFSFWYNFRLTEKLQEFYIPFTQIPQMLTFHNIYVSPYAHIFPWTTWE